PSWRSPNPTSIPGPTSAQRPEDRGQFRLAGRQTSQRSQPGGWFPTALRGEERRARTPPKPPRRMPISQAPPLRDRPPPFDGPRTAPRASLPTRGLRTDREHISTRVARPPLSGYPRGIAA
ncbi:hypothetical protein IscW_ISCW002678, partial [Ixodes scapularis]